MDESELLGGEEASVSDRANVCYALGRACASTGLIYAMHQMMVAALACHAGGSAWHPSLLRRIAGGLGHARHARHCSRGFMLKAEAGADQVMPHAYYKIHSEALLRRAAYISSETCANSY